MTRFARAKGSKSSNEKLPDEATPWSELKKEILMKNKKLDEETKKRVSFLKAEKPTDKPPQWFSLDDDYTDSLILLRKHLQADRKKENPGQDDFQVKGNVKKVKENKLNCTKESHVAENIDKKNKEKHMDNLIDGKSDEKKKRKKKISVSENVDEFELPVKEKKKKMKNDGSSNDSNVTRGKDAMKKPKKRKLESDASIVAGNEEMTDLGKTEREKKSLVEESTGKECRDNEKELQGRNTRTKKKKMKNVMGGKLNDMCASSNKSRGFKKGSNKFRNKGNVENFKTNNFTTKINVGGETVSLIKYQGFYVTKDDAKRLKELKQKMVEEGIPESQIESAIRLERRRCEKSLARMKKNVCFQCRRPGHILSQCPEMQNSIETGTGVCYKCGSTEHKAFTCKVMQGSKFPFAECFICKEKGHIARECPDNPRGLYPKGGCCKLCGDVTHLKKDCPKRLSEQEERTIKLGLRDERDLEGLEVDSMSMGSGFDDGQQEQQKRRRKLVQF